VGPDFSRRSLLRGAGAAGLAALIPAEVLAACGPAAHPVLTDHELSVITEATARLIPGPTDDPSEAGHPGAREANVTNYIATLLAALHTSPPLVWAGGPFSDRAGNPVDQMEEFVALGASSGQIWKARLAEMLAAYQAGIAALDAAARGRGGTGFLDLDGPDQDAVLATDPKVAALPAGYSGFTDMLFAHAIEGTYGNPEYGGNRNGVGWQDIGFPGDSQPRGYTDAEVTNPLSQTPCPPSDAVTAVLHVLSVTTPKPVRPDRPPAK